MTTKPDSIIRDRIEAAYRIDSRRIFATLIRLLGDFDLAEDALQDAFRTAIEQWPRDGVPANPRAWLVSVGRFKGIDRLRRQARRSQLDDFFMVPNVTDDDMPSQIESVPDDLLRLIFACCHPALAPDAQVALTLREVCGLTTEEIANAFLIRPATLAQRIVRAKAKIRDAHIPYSVPSATELPQRLESVLRVIYLVFNEGYFSSIGDTLHRKDLSDAAIRLGRLLAAMMDEPEVAGLLALMLLTDARREARNTPGGDIIPLEDQDRHLWDRGQIAEGLDLVRKALSAKGFGPYTLQAAIAALHAEASSPADTDWPEIVGLYDLLLKMAPSPVVELNRAVAVAMRDGPLAGINLIEALMGRGALNGYPLAFAALAELYRRNGNKAEALIYYHRALALTNQLPEMHLFQRRLAEIEASHLGRGIDREKRW